MISKFTLVRYVATGGSAPRVQAWSGSAESPGLTHTIAGVTLSDSEFDQRVYVMRRGKAENVTQAGGETWIVGDVLWAKAGGVVTNVRPDAPVPQVLVGFVHRAVGGGVFDVAVNVTVFPSLYEISNVRREALADKDVLIWKASTGVAEPRQIDHGSDLAGLADDDHPQYLKEEASGGTAAEVPDHTHASAAQCGQVDHGDAHTAASLLDAADHPQFTSKHGFERNAAGTNLVTLSYDKTTRKVTLTPTGASFVFFVNGVRFEKTGAQVAGTAHGTTFGRYYFYYDSSGGLQVSAVETPWSILDRTVIPVAVVYWSSTLSDGWSMPEFHGSQRDLYQHYEHHFTEGTQLIRGGAASGYTLNTDSDAAVTLAIAAVTIADEDNVHTLSALADGGPYMLLYRSSASGEWVWDSTPVFPFRSGTYPKFNDPNGGGAGVWGETELVGTGGGEWLNVYVLAVPANVATKQLAFVPGQAKHTSLASALAEDFTNLAMGVLPFEEVVPLYRLTLHARSTYAGTHKVQLQALTSIVAKGVNITQSSSASVHNSLAGRSDPAAHPITAISTTETDTSKRLAPDGAGGVAWGTGGAGGGALADLTDVDLGGLTDGDLLAWDDGSGLWLPVAPGTPAAHASTHENGGGDEISVAALSGLLADAQKIEVSKAGTLIGTRKRVNLIEGSNATITVADNAGDDRVDVTIAASGGGGGGTVHHQHRFAMWSPPNGASLKVPLIEVSVACTAKAVRCIHSGSGTLSVNAIKNQRGTPSDILASDLASASTWSNAAATGGGVSLSAGDEIDVELVGVSGFVEYVVVIVDCEEEL